MITMEGMHVFFDPNAHVSDRKHLIKQPIFRNLSATWWFLLDETSNNTCSASVIPSEQ